MNSGLSLWTSSSSPVKPPLFPTPNGSRRISLVDSDDDNDNSESDENSDTEIQLRRQFRLRAAAQLQAQQQPKQRFRLSSKDSNIIVPAPLPLLTFQEAGKEVSKPRTITGESIPSFENSFIDSPATSSGSALNSLHDPRHSKRISKWFVVRSQREVSIRQSGLNSFSNEAASSSQDVSDAPLQSSSSSSSSSLSATINPVLDSVIYDSRFLLDDSISTTSTANNSTDPVAAVVLSSSLPSPSPTAPSPSVASSIKDEAASDLTPENSFSDEVVEEIGKARNILTLQFDSNFESGNLERAVFVEGRENILTPKLLELVQDYTVPQPVAQEYDLTLRKDINTTGNIQWYYFSATSLPDISEVGPAAGVQYPFRVRFQIINMQKKDGMYVIIVLTLYASN